MSSNVLTAAIAKKFLAGKLGDLKGFIAFKGFTAIEAAAAAALSGHKGRLYLTGLTSLSDDAAEALRLPSTLALAIYRISQEAVTNVARHAQASAATLALSCWGDARPGAPLRIDWSASDDGVGLTDADAVSLRGKGIAGIQARVWSQGGELRCEPLKAGSANPGLRLSASFSSTWCAKSLPLETRPRPSR